MWAVVDTKAAATGDVYLFITLVPIRQSFGGIHLASNSIFGKVSCSGAHISHSCNRHRQSLLFFSSRSWPASHIDPSLGSLSLRSCTIERMRQGTYHGTPAVPRLYSYLFLSRCLRHSTSYDAVWSGCTSGGTYSWTTKTKANPFSGLCFH
jgi:hypothetical protein